MLRGNFKKQFGGILCSFAVAYFDYPLLTVALLPLLSCFSWTNAGASSSLLLSLLFLLCVVLLLFLKLLLLMMLLFVLLCCGLLLLFCSHCPPPRAPAHGEPT